MSRRDYHTHDPAPFPLYNRTKTASRRFLTGKIMGRKNQENDSQTGSHAWRRQCLRKGGLGQRDTTHLENKADHLQLQQIFSKLGPWVTFHHSTQRLHEIQQLGIMGPGHCR